MIICSSCSKEVKSGSTLCAVCVKEGNRRIKTTLMIRKDHKLILTWLSIKKGVDMSDMLGMLLERYRKVCGRDVLKPSTDEEKSE